MNGAAKSELSQERPGTALDHLEKAKRVGSDKKARAQVRRLDRA